MLSAWTRTLSNYMTWNDFLTSVQSQQLPVSYHGGRNRFQFSANLIACGKVYNEGRRFAKRSLCTPPPNLHKHWHNDSNRERNIIPVWTSNYTEQFWNDSRKKTKVITQTNHSAMKQFEFLIMICKAWFPYGCICRICRVCRTKKIHRADRIHSISYKKLYMSFLLYWAFVREVSIKLYLSYEFFS